MGLPCFLLALCLLSNAPGPVLCTRVKQLPHNAEDFNSLRVTSEAFAPSSSSTSHEAWLPQGMTRWSSYPLPSIVVCKGCGLFASVQNAVDTALSLNKSQVVILILPGVYREKVIIPKTKTSLMLQGRDPFKTVIQFDDTAGTETTFWSCTLCVAADNFVAHNITVVNSAFWPGLEDKSTRNTRMAVAMRISGSGAAFYNCRFLGWQDTLYDHQGYHFFHECYIEGIVDFVFGDGTSIYKKCVFQVKAGPLGGSIAAQKRSSMSSTTGFIFDESVLTGTGKVYLGRAWGPASRVVITNSFIGNIVARGAWNDWGVPARQYSAFFAQYNCWGQGAIMSNWVDWTQTLDTPAALSFTSLDFIRGTEWLGPILGSGSGSLISTRSGPTLPSGAVSYVQTSVKTSTPAHPIGRGTMQPQHTARTWASMKRIFPDHMDEETK